MDEWAGVQGRACVTQGMVGALPATQQLIQNTSAPGPAPQHLPNTRTLAWEWKLSRRPFASVAATSAAAAATGTMLSLASTLRSARTRSP